MASFLENGSAAAIAIEIKVLPVNWHRLKARWHQLHADATFV